MSDTLGQLIADMSPEKRRLLAELLGSTREPIAIVGMACRFPGADSPEAFWKLLEQGVDAIREVPANRWDIDKYYDADSSRPGKIATRFGAFMDQVDQFDAPFFGLTPREAARMDPQHRLLLEVGWEAIENAGQSADRLSGTSAGVFAGVSTNDYWFLQVGDIANFDGHSAMGGAHCVAAGRLSYLLDLQGPNVAIDTACSSSLVAVHLACQSLWTKESDLAIAGGVNVMVAPVTMVSVSRWGMLAPDGHCKTFDKGADGFVRGEGCGMVVLKRLSDALADRDRILAVIHGSAINHDGRSTRLSAPNGRAQEAVIQKALDIARLKPSQITFVEAHGTGTSLGDPIEVEALKAVVGQPRTDGSRCALGSVKTNIGHLEAAAGVAGLIKTVLCLQHKTIPPHLHLKELNPGIVLEGSPFFISKEKKEWTDNGRGRFAGVSAFGLSGTNAHVIVGEAPKIVDSVEPEPESPQACLLALSARSPAALESLASSYRDWILSPESSGASLEDICHTATVRRSAHPYRTTVIGNSKEEIAERLAVFTREPVVGPPVFNSPRVAFVFSGQGSQWAGMGKQLYNEDRVFRETLEACDSLIRKQAGWSLITELFADEAHSKLGQTEIAQPAIFSIQAGLVARFKAWGVSPNAVVGHSVGEIAAAYAASALTLDEAIRVAIHRGKLMQRAQGKGRMAAVGLSYEECESFISAYPGQLSVAAVNSPTSCVLAGDPAALLEVVQLLKDRGIFCRDLGVDYAFHTPQMEPLMSELADVLKGLSPRATSIRMMSTVTGSDAVGESLNGLHWARTMREPVRFADAIERLGQDGYDSFIEIGPAHVLGTPISECLRACALEGTVLASLRKGRDGRASLLTALGSLFAAGCNVDWKRVYPKGRFVLLPTYPWQRRRYWISSSEGVQKPVATEGADVTVAERKNVAKYYDNVSTLTDGHSQHVLLTFAPFREPVPGFSWLHVLHDPLAHPEGVALTQAAQAELRRVLFRGIDFVSIRSVLDFGCGYGNDLVMLGEKHPHLRGDGFTISSKQAEFGNLEIARRGFQDRLSIYNLDSSKDEFPRRYDLVFGFEVAHYVDDKHKLFSNIDRHLNDGGFVVLADFVARTVSEIRDQATSSYFPTADQWSELLAAYKLKVIECVDVSQEMSNFLHDPDAQANLDLMSKRAADGDAVRRHFASYEGLGRMFRKKLCTYGLITIQKDPYLSKEVITEINRERLKHATPYPEAIGWVEPSTATKTGLRLKPDAEATDCLYAIEWRRSPIQHSSANSVDPGSWLIFADRGGVGEALSQQLRAAGQSAVVVTAGAAYERSGEARFKVCTSRRDDFTLLFANAFSGGLGCRGIVNLWGLDATPGDRTTLASLKADQDHSCSGLLHLVQALTDAEGAGRPRVWVATQGAQNVEASGVQTVSQGTLWGLGRTIASELPTFWGGLIDLDPAAPAQDSARAISETLLAGDSEDQVAWRKGERYVARLVKQFAVRSSTPNTFKSDGSYLLTGGLGALALQVASRMVEAGARDLIFLQRSKLPARNSWADVAAGTGVANQIAAIRELESKGARVHLFSADVAKEDQVEAVLRSVGKTLPQLRGIVHAAGVLDDGILSQMNPGRFDQVMTTKVGGAWTLHRLTANMPLDFFVCFSSLAALLGSPGQANYAAANAGLDSLMQYRRKIGLPGLSINWGAWSEVGMAAADAKRGERVAQQGFGSITPAQGVQVFEQLLHHEQLLHQDRSQVAVVPLDLKRLSQIPMVANAPLFSELIAPARSVSKTSVEKTAEPVAAQQEASNIRKSVLAAEPQARRRLLQDYLTVEMAKILQLSPSELHMNRPLNSLGIDSLMAVEIRNRIESDLPVRVQMSTLLEGSSADDLARSILSQLQSQTAASPKTSDRAARVKQELEQMSDEDVRALLEAKRQEANRRRSTQ